MDSAIQRAAPDHAARMRAFALAATLIAIVVYPIGIGLPALTVEKMGRIRESSVLDGVRNLFNEDRIFLGCVIGITALILPPLKMFGLIWLCVASDSSRLRRRFAPMLTLIGRWGFLDLFVAGLLVAWVQMNSLIRFEPRIGLIFFGISVLLSYLASISLERVKPTNSTARDGAHFVTRTEPAEVKEPTPTVATPPAILEARKRRTWLSIALAGVALLLGLTATWVYYRQARNQLEVTIRFDDAHGLRTGADVRHRGVIVGRVTEVRIRPDAKGVIVRIRLQPEAEELARTGSQFYIVRPTLSLSTGIRGLDTAIGDVYMEVSRPPGTPDGRATEFDGIEEPPLPDVKPGSRSFKFTAKRLSLALTAGAPVKCSGFQIGHIRTLTLAPDGKKIDGTFVIEKEYLPLIDTQTKFAAVSLLLAEGTFAIKMRLEVPALSGGIEIKQIPAKANELAPEGHSFTLEE